MKHVPQECANLQLSEGVRLNDAVAVRVVSDLVEKTGMLVEEREGEREREKERERELSLIHI